MAVAEKAVVNGVDLDALDQAVQTLKQNPDLAQFKFRARNQWFSGHHSRARIDKFYGLAQEDTSRAQPFVLEIDEPAALLGGNAGPNPVETVLGALSGCLTSALVLAAAWRGIELQEVESSLEGDIDVRGFLAIAPDVRKGFQNIRVTFHVKADAPREEVEKLVDMAQKLSPVYDIVTNKVPVDVRLGA